VRKIAWISLLALLLAAPAAADESGAAAADAEKYSGEELAEIVGPIALYPDIVITSVLPASTEPMDVVSAARWLEKQEGEVKGAPEDSTWSDAVQALVQFPDVLIWMNENLDWMKELGYAVSVQQEDVLAAIQAFRKKSKDAGNLESNEKQTIVENNNIIEVQPADPQVVYVPQYNPVYVTQPAASYPATYRGTFWAGFAAGAVGAWAVHSIRWGGYHGGHYSGGGIHINNSPTYNFNKGGTINRVGTSGAGRTYRPKHPANTRAGGGAPRRGGSLARPRSPTWSSQCSKARSPQGGLRAPSRKPSASRPSGRSRPAPSRRPSKAPSARPSRSRSPRTSARPDRSRPPRSKSSLGGSNRGGSAARRSSSRGHRSQTKSRSGASSRSRSSSAGRSRSSSAGRSRSSSGGRSRSSGGSRGGGGRRR